MQTPIETALVSEVAEGQMLAAMMQSVEAIDAAAALNVDHKCFGVPFYQEVFHAIASLYTERRETSLAAILHELKKGKSEVEPGNVERLRMLAATQITPGKIKELGPILLSLSRRRVLNVLGEWVSQKSINGTEPDVIIDRAMGALLSLGDERRGRGWRGMDSIITDIITNQDTDVRKPLPLGIPKLDALLGGGIYETELMGIAGKTSRGKTCLAGNVALHNARGGIPVAYLTLEISAEEITKRLISAYGGVDFRDIREGRTAGNAAFARAAGEIAEMPLYIEDSPGITLTSVMSKLHRIMREKQPELIFVDYIQKMYIPGYKGNRAEEVGVITTQLHEIGREYENRIIIVSQLNRGNADRKWPTLGDLRDSGRIEEDCATVILLHRDEIIPGRKFNPDTTAIVAKQRNGGLGVVKLGFDGIHQRFYEIQEPEKGKQ